MKRSREEFEKARNEICPYSDKQNAFIYKEGADWACDWCEKKKVIEIAEHANAGVMIGIEQANDKLRKQQAENERLKKQFIVFLKALSASDDKIRQMRVDGEITIQEMIIALEPIMWIKQALEPKEETVEIPAHVHRGFVEE